MYAERITMPDESEDLPGINYVIGLDLGQAQDYSATAIIEKKAGGVYHVVKLERVRNQPYPQIVARTNSIVRQLRGSTLVIDGTGVGRPVADMFDQAGLRPIVINIHAGNRVSCDTTEQVAARARGWVPGMPRRWGVPKRDLVGVLQVLLQNKRLKIAPGPLSDTLATEMLDFKVTIDPTTANDSYSAWREQDHDDLTLAVSLAIWWAEHGPKPPIVPDTILTHARV